MMLNYQITISIWLLISWMKGGLRMPQVIKMDTIILYHGSPNKIVTPIFGGGDDKHDYGRGFYLTENIGLAKEWAVCRPNEQNG